MDYIVIILLLLVVHAKKRQLHALHVYNPIGRYIHVHVISSQITGNGYAWVRPFTHLVSARCMLSRLYMPFFGTESFR